MIFSTDQKGVASVNLQGFLDESNALFLAQTMESLMNEGKHKIVLDVSQLWNLDQMGLHVIMTALHQARKAEGDIRLAKLSPRLKELVSQLELEKQFLIFPNLEEAQKSFRPKKKPRRIRLPLPFKQDVGLGDLIKKMTTAVGIKPCSGCEERAKKLNNMFVFSGNQELDSVEAHSGSRNNEQQLGTTPDN